MSLRFAFNERKAAQAAAHLLGLNGGKMPYMKLIKLLYLADRAMLVKHGKTITGDQLVSMKHGPVLSNVLDLINNQPQDSLWITYVGPAQNYEVALSAGETAPDDELSRFELRLLDETFAQYGAMDMWTLVDVLHKILPEWKDPGESSSDIDPEEILRLAQWPDEAIADAKNSAIEARFLASIAEK